MFLTSLQGTWDKTKSPTRAQFGGNNILLNSYFGSFSKEYRILASELNTTAELIFKIDTLGNVDSVVFAKTFGNPNLDNMIKNIVESTAGKWRAGQIDGKKVSEYNRIWIHIYADYKDKMTLVEFIAEASKQIENEQYEKAVKNLDKALRYDELNINATKLKGQCLIKLKQKEKACELWNSFRKYETLEIENLLIESCE